MLQVRQRRRDFSKDWLQRVANVPKDYPTLTEAQWIEAVRYFNGCAMCNSESVDTRKYFVPFEQGGRYCDWNIIPICEACAKKTRVDFNYFVWRPAGINKIQEYLEERLNAAIGKQISNSNTGAEPKDKGTGK